MSKENNYGDHLSPCRIPNTHLSIINPATALPLVFTL
ncbi:Uncharacterised protein [Corynebacterium ulcerans]|nr:Uncharacterised protein [Corynebacterium ulcerans]